MKDYMKKAQRKYKKNRYEADDEFKKRTLAINKKWRDSNQEQAKNSADKYRNANQDKINTYSNDWRRCNAERTIAHGAKARAKKKNIEYSITHEDIIIPEYCPVLNHLIIICDRQWGPSIDRIDNTKGYTKDNIIIVSRRANELKRDASVEEMILLSEFYSNPKNLIK